MEKELYYALSDNADMSCVCATLREVADLIDIDLGDIDPKERVRVFYTVTPLYLTEIEFKELSDAQF
ncbi:hypothetical protein [Pedobacter cryoconitis]|uniref:Uncharacterized protein n=1 Tax=Pedobacter cryoconitis TaxID=188932 RepID=A0A327SK88_9SPHI|nr:hypothetical protein [Pedobacter cryoconitis]RAJ28892.1 hypothetical protein LY11_03166 [Pedobacter cryoconitis]